MGIFFLDYDENEEHEFTWTEDLAEIVRIGTDKKLKVTRRFADEGEKLIGEWPGGWRRGVIGVSTHGF